MKKIGLWSKKWIGVLAGVILSGSLCQGSGITALASEDAGMQVQIEHKDGSQSVASVVEHKDGSQSVASVVYNGAAIEGKEGWLFYALDNSIADYQGTNLMSEKQMNRYLDRMTELQQVCDAQGKQLYYLIPPNKEQVYAEYMPDYSVKDSYKRAQRLADYIQENSEINVVYPLAEMLEAKVYCRTYLKNDTHWTNCGAFIGLQALYERMGLLPTPLFLLARSEMPVEEGDLIILGELNAEDYAGDFDYIINYKPEVECISPQDFRFHEMIFSAESSSENKCRVVVIGDSFCMKMSPFLMKDFSECMVVHRNWIHDPDVETAIREADVIVIESLERMTYSLLNTSSNVKEILETPQE